MPDLNWDVHLCQKYSRDSFSLVLGYKIDVSKIIQKNKVAVLN